MREGAVNVLVARGAARAHILPEYGLGWTGADGLAALEPTRDLLHGNEPSAGGGAWRAAPRATAHATAALRDGS